MANVGINVIEIDGPAAPAIQPANTSVSALVGITERGVPNQPVRVTSIQQYTERFGGHRADALLSYGINGFFKNNGREAIVSRVVGVGSTAASANLNDRQAVPEPALQLAAGYRGERDPGDWGERLRIDIRDDPRGTTTLQVDTVANATSAQLTSLAGVSIGTVLRFVEGASTEYRRVSNVDALSSTVDWVDPIVAPLTAAGTEVTTAEFRLIVRYQTRPGGDFETVEEWPHLSMEIDSDDYAVDRINGEATGSRYVTAIDLSAATDSGVENPAIASDVRLLGGAEASPSATEFNGDRSLRSGMFAFDTSQVQLLAVPDAHTLSDAGRISVVRAAIDYCASRGDCMFIGTAPDRGNTAVDVARSITDYTQLESDYLGTVKTYAANFQANKVYGALYAPFIKVADPIGPGPAPSRFVPPELHIMGVFARTEQQRGIFKAPAGIASQVRGALAISADFTDLEHDDLVRNGLVNGVRFDTGLGITLSTSRTLSSNNLWRFIPTRLLFNFVKSSLRDGLRFIRQEPHTEATRRTVRLSVITPFLLSLWRQGAFGSRPPEDVFLVKCDAENNPPNEVKQGHFNVEVFFHVVSPIETIVLAFGISDEESSVQES